MALAAPFIAARPRHRDSPAPPPDDGDGARRLTVDPERAPSAAEPPGVAQMVARAADPQQGSGADRPAMLPDVAAPGPLLGDRRWSLAGWLLWRPSLRPSLGQGPLLGGSQAGVRLDFALGGGVALYGRVTRAFERPFAEEGAVGIAWRPDIRLPLALMAERRQRLGPGGRSAFALLAAGGIGPQALSGRIDVAGDAQAGFVGRPGADGAADGFADGRFSLDYRLTRPGAQPALAIGGILAASAQPGAARFDLGPAVRLRLPVAAGGLRLSAEWRARLAGAARPASGPAITLVADF
jgi:hypothetical protein